MESKKDMNQILLVEGKDDQHVIWALCEKHQMVENFEVIDCKGINKLIEQTPIRFKTSGIRTVGIIIDADDQLDQRWEKVKGVLQSSGFSISGSLPEDGLIVSNDTHKAGVWMMPDNKINGMLEDFISFLIPEGDQLLPMVNSTLEDIESNRLNRYNMHHHAKAEIHTWLAWQEDPGTPMGASITKRYLTTEQETCMKLIDWMKNLFS